MHDGEYLWQLACDLEAIAPPSPEGEYHIKRLKKMASRFYALESFLKKERTLHSSYKKRVRTDFAD